MNYNTAMTEKKHSPLKIILFSFVALVLNFIVAKLCGFGSFLFMDTVFPMALLFYFGLLPALVVQILFNVISAFLPMFITGNYNGAINALYGLAGVAIVLVTWLFSRKKEKFCISPLYTVLYLLLASFCAALASCVVAGIVNNFIMSVSNIDAEHAASYEKIFLSLFGSGILPFIGLILGRIPVTLCDRIITTFLGFGICKLVQKIEK
ncbi:MAG: hypothetical protein KBT11_11330 [Treponema sp.]|nr:hypothetical protein [Candidatus Treponema equifaecale]